ncbi:MAG: hypothetical protein ACSLFA_04865, partial [Mycobacterium sp.]
DTNKLASKKQTTHKTREDGKSPKMSGKKQQTKTTKHTIEFSNNTPDRPRNNSRLKSRGR